MAKRHRPVAVGLLVHERSAPAPTLLVRDILLRANELPDARPFEVTLIGRRGLERIIHGPVALRISRSTTRFEHVIVAPLSFGADPFEPRRAESALIAQLHDAGAAIHTACIGSLLLAQTTLLDEREATTHWRWAQEAIRRFPRVQWRPERILCDLGDVVTAGGYLAIVDLTLALVARVSSRRVARELGRLLLADSSRQRQSVYAATLTASAPGDPVMGRFEQWLDRHLYAPVTTRDMARACNLGTRTFHRQFVKAYNCTPKKFIQLKRIERVRTLLEDVRMSVEDAIERTGVSDVPSFRKVFQRELGVSPAEYRRQFLDR